MEKVPEVLKQIPLFIDLTDTEIQTLSRDFKFRQFRKDEIIFHEDDSSDSLYILSKGRIRIFRYTESGKEISFSVISAPEIFGELSALDGKPRSCTVKATRKCNVLQMGRKEFLRHISAIPKLSQKLIKLLAEKVRSTTEYAATICQYSTAGRLMRFILFDFPLRDESPDPRKSYTLDLGLNQSDLASLIGAGRERVNKILRHWKKQGIIDYQRGQLTIKDIRAARDQIEEENILCEYDKDW